MEYSDPDWCSLPLVPVDSLHRRQTRIPGYYPLLAACPVKHYCNRSNPDMLYDLIKSHAALFFMQRQKKTSKDGTFCVYADESDFAVANEVFTFLNGTAGGQETKLTCREADLLAAIQGADQRNTPYRTSRDSPAGRTWVGTKPSRVMNAGGEVTPASGKVPGDLVYRQDHYIDRRGRQHSAPPVQAYAWDREVPEWNGGSACWLSDSWKEKQ